MKNGKMDKIVANHQRSSYARITGYGTKETSLQSADTRVLIIIIIIINLFLYSAVSFYSSRRFT